MTRFKEIGKTVVLEEPLTLDDKTIVGIIKWGRYDKGTTAYTSKGHFENRLKAPDVKDYIKFYE